MESFFSKSCLDRRLVVALRENDFDFKVTEHSDPKSYSLYEVAHLKIYIYEDEVLIRGDGIKERYKAIDFRVRPGLEKEVVSEITAFLFNPEKKSTSLCQWLLFFTKMKRT